MKSKSFFSGWFSGFCTFLQHFSSFVNYVIENQATLEKHLNPKRVKLFLIGDALIHLYHKSVQISIFCSGDAMIPFPHDLVQQCDIQLVLKQELWHLYF